MRAHKVAVKALAQVIGAHLAEIHRGEDEPELTMQIMKFAHGSEEDRLATPFANTAHRLAREYAGMMDRLIGVWLYNEDPVGDAAVEYVDDLLQEYATMYGDADAGESEHPMRFEKLEVALRCAINPTTLKIWMEADD